jgi:programmed cell death 6-interacting protein
MPNGLLLAVHCKRGEPAPLKEAVIEYISATYGRRAAEDAADDLGELEALRATVAAGAPAPGLRDALARYHRALCAMEARFPFSGAPGHVDVAFAWHDAFQGKRRPDAQQSVFFEQAAVVFNLGAALSQGALAVDRAAPGGLMESARLFQEAAGAFAFLREGAAPRVDAPCPIDVSPECAGMLERLMLAQAQECVLERAAADGKAPATLARVAKHAAALYDDVSRALAARPLADHFDRSWHAHAAVKALLHHLEADLQGAAALRLGDELKGVAAEVSRLRAAAAPLAAAKREAKSASRELQANVAEKEAAVAERLRRAERENASVYLQRVPAAADLPPIVPAALVKPTPPADLRADEAAGRLFAGVVPEAGARALSRYAAQVDALVRRQAGALAAASDEARLCLREWELPEALHALEPGHAAALPDAVRLELEAVAAAGGAPQLGELAEQLRALRREAGAALDAADAELAAEAREDAEARAGPGAARLRAPPSAQAAAPYTDRARGYRGNLAAAADADARLEARLDAEAPALAALEPCRVAAAMPRLEAPMLSVDDLSPAAAVATLRRSLDALGALSAQRAALEEALKARKNADDILPRLLAVDEADADALFAEELKKYDGLVAEAEASLAQQAALLGAIGAAQRVFREAYGFEQWRRDCEGAAAGARAGAAAFAELQGNLSEGVRFYSGLQEAIAALRRDAGGFVAARRAARAEAAAEARREADAAARMAGMRLGGPPPPPGGGAYAPQPAYPQHGVLYPQPPAPQPGEWNPLGGPHGYGYGAPPPQQLQPPPPQQQQYSNPMQRRFDDYGRPL